MSTQTNTVLYGRESSSNPRALNNQRNTLINKANQNNSNYTTLFETISGGNGMSKKLQKAISKENIDTLYVTQINRIARNINAIDHIRSHLKYLYVTSENRLYDVEKEWNIILNGLTTAELQIKDIIDSHKKDYNNKKRGYSNDDFNTEINSSKNKKKRFDLYEIFNNYDTEKLAEFVCGCSRIDTDYQLKKLSICYKKLYPVSNIYNVYRNNSFPFHLRKDDVKYYIKQAAPDIDDVFINDFYNAHLLYEKKFKDFELKKELDRLSI